MSTIRAFALEVLRSEALAPKLVAPPLDLADDDRSGEVPRAPGRPRNLVPVARERTPMPRTTQLASAEKRAVCLHRFANHELQAVEVMAWALLAFPDAPVAFRRGVLATLSDEQVHLQLYMKRLESLGVAFGDLPVNDYFWARTGDLLTPLRYVSAMGLTFEAANLDHTVAYRDAFASAGDLESSEVIDRVHRDEVGHVSFAVSWLRKWKQPGETDWDAWQASLVFPLGPHRARGAVFLRKPRIDAGLERDFVDRLETVPARMLSDRAGPGPA